MSFGYRLETDGSESASKGVTLSYGLPRVSEVTLEVSDAAGSRVRLLVSGTLAAGDYVVDWDGTTDGGLSVPDGVYRARLTANAAGGRAFIQTRLITLRHHP